MRNVVLRPGSSGPFVRDLQLALNSRLNPSPNLIVNGLMTPQTQLALRSFQRANWLEEDGIAGPCTLDAIYDTEAMRPIQHLVTYVAQPTPETGWAAAVAMLKGNGIGTIQFATPKALLDQAGGLFAQKERNPLVDGHFDLGRAHGLKYFPQQNWPIATLISWLQRGPAVMVLKSPNRGTGRSKISSSPYIVIVGTRGSHAPDGNSTTLRVYDPAPDRLGGGIYSATYSTLLHDRSLSSYGSLTL